MDHNIYGIELIVCTLYMNSVAMRLGSGFNCLSQFSVLIPVSKELQIIYRLVQHQSWSWSQHG